MNAPPVQYVTTSDGYDIAYRVTGSGTPLVLASIQLATIEVARQLFPQWLEGLAQRFQLVQFDCRGEGYSTRNLPDGLTTADFGLDIAAVIDRLGLERFLIHGLGIRSHSAVRYAHAHPERVAGLILSTCAVSNTVFKNVIFTALPKDDWNTFLNAIVPHGLLLEEHKWWVNLARGAMTPDDFDAHVRAYQDSSVKEELQQLRVPTLVLYPRDFPRFPASESMKVAALIPDARFQLIDGGGAFGEAGQGLAAIDAFVADLPPLDRPAIPAAADGLLGNLSEREVEVLRLLAQGKSNPQIAEALFITRNTVQNHVGSILTKTNLSNRTEAAVYAQQHGLA